MNCNEYGTASFKGIEFEMLTMTMSSGRNIVTNEYPFSNYHYNEDIGGKPVTWSITGAFYGSDFRKKAWLANRVWSVEGDGVLFEPTTNRSYSLRLVDWKIKSNGKTMDYIEFSMDLVEMANAPYPKTDRNRIDKAQKTVDEYIKTASRAHAEMVQIIGDII